MCACIVCSWCDGQPLTDWRWRRGRIRREGQACSCLPILPAHVNVNGLICALLCCAGRNFLCGSGLQLLFASFCQLRSTQRPKKEREGLRSTGQWVVGHWELASAQVYFCQHDTILHNLRTHTHSHLTHAHLGCTPQVPIRVCINLYTPLHHGASLMKYECARRTCQARWV